MVDFKTISEGFLACNFPDRGVNFIEGENSERFLSYAELQKRAKGILYHLQRKGMTPGDELIMIATRPDQFVDIFWSSILGGIVPVPLSFGISEEHRLKVFRVFEKLKRPFICLERANLERLGQFAEAKGLKDEYAELHSRSLILDEIEDIENEGIIYEASPEDTAFIQFSSGSTSEPKGVVLTHKNLITNVRAIAKGMEVDSTYGSVSWMPLTHDMGLIGFHIGPIMVQVTHHLIPVEIFIRRPMIWLSKASEKGVNVICSPNFGYKHFLKAFTPEKAEGWDLSKIKLVLNGAEPISIDLCQEFLQAMKPFGLGENTMFPVYGLAEASLAVTFPKVGEKFKTYKLDRNSLGFGESVSLSGDENSLAFISEGKPVQDCQVKIADQEGNEFPEMKVGLVWIKGDNVTRGYYDLDELNQSIIKDDWLNTGDLGVIIKGELVITGRDKDIIFVNGQNYYPHDLELIAEKHAGIEMGKVAFCGARKAGASEDEILAFVIHRGKPESFMQTATDISREINMQLGIVINHVIPVDKIPKTTSGKMQRYLLSEEYLNGDFDGVVDELEKLRGKEKEAPINAEGISLQLQNICAELITEIKVGPDDNIFEIGTNSLTLALIHERLDELYPGKLDVTDFFDYPTINEMSKYLEGKLKG